MLQGDFFTILFTQQEDVSGRVVIKLNPNHPIFAGHFPGQPVLPGACLLQMVKETMQNFTGEELQLVKANHLKFISIIDPSKNNILEMALTHKRSENNEWVVSATLTDGATTCFKFSGSFKGTQ